MSAGPGLATMLLSVEIWDLALDASGNLALATGAYALEQDVASAARTFAGEVYYDTSLGVPYLQQILGLTPPLSVFQAAISAEALRVPGVATATVTINSYGNDTRAATGAITFTDNSGNSLQAGV